MITRKKEVESEGSVWSGKKGSVCAEYPVILDVTYIKDQSQLGELKIFPNPTQGSITIELGGLPEEQYDVSILNLLGEQVYSLSTNDETINVDLSDYSTGVYFITATTEKSRFTCKLVKH